MGEEEGRDMRGRGEQRDGVEMEERDVGENWGRWGGDGGADNENSKTPGLVKNST